MPISSRSNQPAEAGVVSEALSDNEQRREKVVEYVMSKVEFARKRARMDMIWLLIAVGIFAGALAISMMNLGPSRAVAGDSCVSQCKARFGQCVASTGDRNGCQSELLACIESCKGG